MFRFVLPVALFFVSAIPGLGSQVLDAVDRNFTPAQTGQSPQKELPPCQSSVEKKKNCMRVLACIGEDGVFFDGQVRGDGVGIILGRTNEGVQCSGHWSRVDGTDVRGEGRARLKCEDGSRFHLVYDSRDRREGTQYGVGKDSKGRMIRAWTGTDVLHFLTKDPNQPGLKCGDQIVPLHDEILLD